jgi:hypothetical protein
MNYKFYNQHNYKFIKTDSKAMHRSWNNSEIRNYINSMKNSDFDKLSFHSWIK